ncbi:S-adenosyl-L-methionine-dependent methyltransferase [Dendrothele bispora CBS 962.96]|uniref:S-adenosyl-L-methionine-dependent methyltransferase n=1 Tax=Dendrothele bispora (strain CBS 962.96) TaxID=1314807 RepID=A0A4S8LHH7_DENBC|nr:S-adenosyl-L-methionine-dependent methyltransferase [Dendrothele bispora CBS 962.96]
MSLDHSHSDHVFYVGEDDSEFFRSLHGRRFNNLNHTYCLPADQDEVKRSELHQRMMQFVFSGRNYIGPVKEALQFGQHRRILDLGTGAGLWAISMADEFPRAEVIGIDLAPLQPRNVPPNCTFELCDINQSPIPYPDNYFDLIHARSMHTGITDYPKMIREIARLLRPGGLVLLIEPSLHPFSEGAEFPTPSSLSPSSSNSHWSSFWETYRNCLNRQGIDVSVPEKLADFLLASGKFEAIVQRDGNIPVGFWPQDPDLLTVGQLQWMDFDLFLPAVRPLFLSLGLGERHVDNLIANAHEDLYHPPVDGLGCRIYIVHASKEIA